MKLKILLLTLLSLPALQVSGQQNNRAQQLLKKLAENNQAHQTIRADFTFHYKSLQSQEEGSWEGQILMKGQKYRLELHHSTVYYDGKTLWNHLHDAEEVNVSEPVEQKEGDILNHPHQIFEIHQMELKHKYLGEERIEGIQMHKIDLYPKDLDKDYSRIRLFLTPSPVQIHSARVFAKDGTRYTIEIDNLVTDKPASDSSFVFDKQAHPKVEVIDMRF